ncbi:ATP-binding protein [Streptomyces sp. NPDC003300]|uniref:sensor histidine kinase n=1 Tax=unclassified Streptomyces TaxID=2593676 RepID=UPI0033BC1C74
MGEHRERSARLVPGILAVLQALWWAVAALGRDASPGPARTALAAAAVAVAFGAMAVRRAAPATALAAAVAAVVGADVSRVLAWAPVTVAAVLVALYSLALRRTAGASALGALLAALTVGCLVLWHGAQPRIVAAGALLACAGAAAVWVRGRSRRWRRALGSAREEYARRAPDLLRHTARGERRGFAAELHDVVAHRLTGVTVSAAAALRLGHEDLMAEATRHAGHEGRLALLELDALADALAVPRRLEEVDALVAAFPGVRYTRTVAAREPAVEPATASLAFRVVREALTNTVRYAAGATVEVRLAVERGDLVVHVRDSGGALAVADLGSGSGLTALAEAVAADGGRLTAGPVGTGWRVSARLPLATGPTAVRESARFRSGRRGPAALDAALALLALAVPLGAGLLPGGGPDVFPGGAGATGHIVLLALLVLHALPLARRRTAPRSGLLAASAVVLLWLGCDRLGVTAPHTTDLLLWCWWGDLVLLYSVAARAPTAPGARRTWPAVLGVAAVAGLAMVSEDVRRVALGWAVFGALAAVPAAAVWACGVRSCGRRRTGADSESARRAALNRAAAEAARAERLRLSAELRATARRPVAAMVAAADADDLPQVLAEARGGLRALRELLTEVREPLDADDDVPPPTVAGIAALAARHRATARLTGRVRSLPAAMEVAAYRSAEALMSDEARVTVHYAADGVEVVVHRRPQAGPSLRRLHAMADAVGGTLATTGDGTVRVWLPEVVPA